MSNTKETNKPNLVWDTCDLVEAEVKYRLENWKDFFDEEPDEDKVRNAIYTDDWLAYEWEMFGETLTESLNYINPDNKKWYAEVNGFGWRGLGGHSTFEAKTGEEFLQVILPKTECTFNIWLDENTIKIQNYHHDSPTGNEWYTITISDKEEEG